MNTVMMTVNCPTFECGVVESITCNTNGEAQLEDDVFTLTPVIGVTNTPEDE